MSVPKKAAINADSARATKIADMTAEQFIAALESASAARMANLPAGYTIGPPGEKKKVELEVEPVWPVRPIPIPIPVPMPEKKKVELEIEPVGPWRPIPVPMPEKKKVELEREPLEERVTNPSSQPDRLDRLEEKLEKLTDAVSKLVGRQRANKRA